MGTELTESNAAVPALAYSAETEITAEDVALPKLKIGQFSSRAVQDELVKPGVLYLTTGEEDPDPVVLGDSVDFHVIAFRKGMSASINGELRPFAFNDPEALQLKADGEDVWVTYQYLVVLPEHDEDVPAKLLLTRSGKPAALNINTVLKKNAGRGPGFINAFRLTTAKRENEKGKWFVPRIAVIEPKPEHVELAERLAQSLSGQSADLNATGDEPEL